MEWDEQIDLSRRKMSSRLIVERALARGWRVCGFETNPAVFLLYIPGREKPVKIFSASPPQMPYPSVKIAKDKFITNTILREVGLPVPSEMLVNGKNYDPQKVAAFMANYPAVVVKPLDASHGKGITVNVRTIEELDRAITEAATHGRSSNLLVQEQIAGVDVRVVCINYAYVDAISRTPASVTGDGIHTVHQLIEATNMSSDRGQNYSARLNVIPLDRAEAFLGVAGLANVPAAGDPVQVIGASNVGMGGVSQNLREAIPEPLRNLAVEAARALDLPVCGIDFMVDHIPGPDDTLETLRPRIIEANECPMLTMYDDLQSSGQQELVDRYLDYVAQY